MNYEKKYNEAIERAKQIAAQGGASRYLVTQIFPELKESEDERIRKELIDIIKRSYEIGGFTLNNKELRDKYIAYLEKQEQKPAWSEDDKRTVDAAIYWLERRLRIEKAYNISTEDSPLSMRNTAERLKSLRPHWRPSEEQMAALKWQVEHPELVKWRKGDLESLLEQLKKL